MRRFVPLLLAAFLVAAEAQGTGAPTVLGSGGELYRVLQGRYSELIPTATGPDAANAALVLEVVRPGVPAERVLVPTSQGTAVEKYPAVTYDKSSGTVLMAWEAQESVGSTLHLAAYAGGTWSDVFALGGDPTSYKYNPQVAITTDTYRVLDATGAAQARTRVVLHLVWWDEAAVGGRAMYAPLTLSGGVIAPGGGVFSLSDFLPVGDGFDPGPIGLYSAPQVRAAGDGTSAVVAFGDRLTGRLATLLVTPLPGSIVHLGDLGRAEIIEIGKTATSRAMLADLARAEIIEIGRRLVAPGVADYLASRAADRIRGADASAPASLIADLARAEIIEIGAQLSGGPRSINGMARAEIIEIGRASESGGPANLGNFRLVRMLTAPSVPEQRPIRLLAAESGGEMALAWDVDNSVRYRQSSAGGWSEARILGLNEQLSRDQAYELLSRWLQQP